MKQLTILGSVLLALTTPVAMAATTWTVSQFQDSSAGTAQAVSISAWSTTGSAGALAAACIGTSHTGIINTVESQSIPCTDNAPIGDHAADNIGQTDLYLLQFSQAVSLAQVSIGWNGTDNWNDFSASAKDSDISVLALKTGFSSNPKDKTLAGLLDATTGGWQVVGNYANVGASNGSASGGQVSFATPITSSWWIVSAYNSTFGGGTGLGDSNDYFKLLSVAVTTPTPPGRVSEPAALLLMGTALFGIVGLRRRRESD